MEPLTIEIIIALCLRTVVLLHTGVCLMITSIVSVSYYCGFSVVFTSSFVLKSE